MPLCPEQKNGQDIIAASSFLSGQEISKQLSTKAQSAAPPQTTMTWCIVTKYTQLLNPAAATKKVRLCDYLLNPAAISRKVKRSAICIHSRLKVRRSASPAARKVRQSTGCSNQSQASSLNDWLPIPMQITRHPTTLDKILQQTRIPAIG